MSTTTITATQITIEQLQKTKDAINTLQGEVSTILLGETTTEQLQKKIEVAINKLEEVILSLNLPTPGNMDNNRTTIMQKLKPGGQSQYIFEVERSEHNQSHEQHIKRDSILGEQRSDGALDTVNFATTAYLRTFLSSKDQIDFKRCGGHHNDDNAKAGQCYPVGVLVDPGNPSKGWLAKEFPEHPKTPRMIHNIEPLNAELPDLNGKTFGLQTIGWATPEGTYKIECYVDTSVLDTPISSLQSPPNDGNYYLRQRIRETGKTATSP